MKKFDFSGWATRNNLKCSDGRTILKDAFKDNDGQTVPLVWNHQHNGPFNVLGHALLENRADGVYAYCTFNDTEQGRNAKLLVEHGDVSALSIFANQLRERASNVLHGAIREVSLVLAGANPGAFIDTVALSHGDDADGEAIIYTGEPISLYHSDTKKEDEDGGSDNPDDKDKNPNKKDGEDDETIEDVIKTFNKKQKDVFYAVVGEIMSQKDVPDDKKKEEEKKGGNETMKHNVFDQKQARTDILSHADGEAIISLAKNNQVGSLQTALQIYADENNLTLQHDATSSGFVQTGDGNVTLLFPEYKDVRPGAPELITSDQGWISVVMRKVHKSPISRIRTGQVDIRNIDALRAKGYEKGKEKKLTGNFKLVRRTTDPQTVYVKNALHRDDIVDITDLDYVQYLYNIDRMMLNEELATAIMLGDGRDEGDADKISPEHIRPIWLDDDLYTLHVDLDVEAAKKELQGTNTGVSFGLNYILAEALINTVLYAREKYKGTGTPDFFCTPHMLNVMLLARDMNGRRIYSSKAELASSLNVGEIVTAEQFEGKTRTTSENKTKKLLGIIANLADYSLGATKGGEVTHFTQFDIDFNQEKSLLETRCSGALTRVYSAIAIEEPVEEQG
ncbi:HK97 family phage prohead protease [uncultured Bacteroides sp.]|jgi:Caudovirus prohead protease.|uniref:HK97 family phage prohead protease n=1 Tax=uncultured Bacteroides sp. TaxID=162156 RepID=UPI00272FB96D|nr:HK97 family phage prohead protease [uncultured Bacteroides sp.]